MASFFSKVRFFQVLLEAISSPVAILLNFLLFGAILLALYPPYKHLGLGLVFLISTIDVWITLRVFSILRSANIGYKILDAEVEWFIDQNSSRRVNSRKKILIHLTRSTKSVCYYLEPGEKIIDAGEVLPVYSHKKCDANVPDGYSPVELVFESYIPKGTKVLLEIETELEKEKNTQSGLMSFYTHNEPQQLSMTVNVSGQNGYRPQMSVDLAKGRRKKLSDIKHIAKYIVEKPYGKIEWKLDHLINDAVYHLKWSYPSTK